MKSDEYFIAAAKYKEGHYNTLLDFFNGESLFKLHFNDFRVFVLKQKLEKGVLSETALEEFITANNGEVGSQSIADYVAAVNANFHSMKIQEHINFFSSLNRKLDGMTLEMSEFVLLRLLVRALQENNLSALLLIKNDRLILNDLIYLFLDSLMNIEVDVKVLCFLEKLAPVLEEVLRVYKDKNNHDRIFLYEEFIKKSALKPLLDELMDLAVHSNFLMRIISLREDLLNNLNPNECITHDGRVFQKSFFILNMARHDDAIFTNLMTMGFFKNVIFSDDVILKYGMNREEIVELLTALVDDDKKQEIWDDLPILMIDFVNPEIFGENIGFQFRILKKLVLRSWSHCLLEMEQNIKNSNRDMLDAHFSQISGLFFVAAERDKIGELIKNDDILMSIFAEHVSMYIMPGYYYYSKKEISQRMINLIDTLPFKDKMWSKIITQECFIPAIEGASELAKKSFLSFSPHLKNCYFQAIKKETDKKEITKKALTEDQLIENKKLLIAKQNDEKVQSKKADVSAQVHNKSSKKNKKKTAVSALTQENSKLLILSEEDKKTFEDGIRAAIAGSPDIIIRWADKTDEYPDHFSVDFSKISNTIKVNGALNQNYSFAIFLEGKKEAFFNTCVPILLKNYLSGEVSVDVKNIEKGILRIAPNIQRCSYPEKMHEASFKHVARYATLSNQEKLSSPALSRPQADKRPIAYRSLLAKPTLSLIKVKEEEQNEISTVNVTSNIDPLMQIKELLQEAVADHFPNQQFRFMEMKKEKTKCIIKFNLKGASCLSNKDQVKLDTYAVMKSLVSTLQALFGKKSAVIKPDNLDPKVYGNKECEVSIETGKANLNHIAKRVPCKLKEQFNYYLKAFQQTIKLYNAIYDCEQEIEGEGGDKKFIVLNSAAEKEEAIICKSYRRLIVEKAQCKCIKALLGEINVLNEMKEKTQDVYVLEAINASRYVCYHRLFDNLAMVFDRNNEKTNAVFASTLRVIFRHGYKDLPADFSVFLDTFIQVLTNYKKESPPVTLFASEKQHYLSFDITRAMQDKLVAGMKSFVQAKSNHAIGKCTRDQRIASVPHFEKAIEKMSELTDIAESQKRTFILSLASLIGEVNKAEPYGNIYGEMGTHNKNVSEMPADLIDRVYDAYWQPKVSRKSKK